jgi:hypothetical protein
LACLVGDAFAARRSIRVDTGSQWDNRVIGTPDCPGSTLGSTLLNRLGHTFSGRDQPIHLFNDYCQASVPGQWDENSFVFGGEDGLTTLVGPNDDDAVSALRYSYLDDDNLNAIGFQWVFYSFPRGLTIVGLYGFEFFDLDASTYIRQGSSVVWSADVDGFDGEYFCFIGSEYRGTWNGELTDSGSACLLLFNSVFLDGFE